jgi:hypothetical protein
LEISVFVDVINMRSWWIRVGIKPVTGGLLKRSEDTDRQRKKEAMCTWRQRLE